MTAEALAAQLEGHSRVCFKPAVDTSSGVGVTLFRRQEDQFFASDGTKLDGQYLEQMGNDWVIQEVIQQHPYMSQFNTSSINTLRVCVYRSLMDVDYSKNDFQIPCWQQVKDMAVSIAHHTPHMRLISAWIPLLPLVSSR